MDSTMFQLRSFVHQRLYSAAEEILGEVQKTITIALFEAEVSRSKEVEGLLHQRDLLRIKAAAEPSLTISTEGNGDKHNDPLPQEIPGPPIPEECNLSLGAELPRPSQTSAELEKNNRNHCLVQTDFKMSEIKEEPEELGDDTQTEPSEFILTMAADPSMTASTAKIEDEYDASLLQEDAGSSTPEESNLSQTQDKDQTEEQVMYEMQPLSSDFSDAESVNNDCDEDLVNSVGTRTRTMKRTGKNLQRQSGGKNEKDQAALTNDKPSAKTKNNRRSCHVCGKTYVNLRGLQRHVKIHGKKDFKCQACGKTFAIRSGLKSHERSHSGEKPFRCDSCGKGFRSKYTLQDHKRWHTSEKPYRCDLCGKLFITRSSLRAHLRFHSAETSHPCDICGDSCGQNR